MSIGDRKDQHLGFVIGETGNMNAKRERLEQFQLFFRGRNTSLNFSRIHDHSPVDRTNSRAFSGCNLKMFAGINGVAVSDMLEGPAS